MKEKPMSQPTFFDDVYLISASHFLPGAPIDNDAMDAFIAPINAASPRIKKRILSENGILTRHYAIDEHGQTVVSHTDMAANALQQCVQQAGFEVNDLDLLVAASSGADAAMPGLANMIQGQLHAAPMEVHSHTGICAASVTAMKDAAQTLSCGAAQLAGVVAAEMPSRIFKESRFASRGDTVDFESHFLRWMLSDGAGAVLLAKSEALHKAHLPQGLALKIDWIHVKSFSGDYPTCMQLGLGSHRAETVGALDANASYLDFDSLAEAEAAGHFALRQNLRILPNLFEIAVHEYAHLVQNGWVGSDEVAHFLCHYSSEALGKVCDELMNQAGLGIARDKWFSNLSTCGNTGSASIFIMLADFLQQKSLKAGQKILAFVPESGRFTVSYFMLTVVEVGAVAPILPTQKLPQSLTQPIDLPLAPHDYTQHQAGLVRHTLLELAQIWHDFRSNVWRTRLVQKINAGQLSSSDYVRWMSQWIPQVREGSLWMRQAAQSLDMKYLPLAALMGEHADDEQFDFEILFKDYQAAGGTVASIDLLKRNAGGDALNAYMYRSAQQSNPIGLLGGIYIIEGTGQRIVPWLLPLIKQQLDLPERCFRFLQYHGENDAHHLERWLTALNMAIELDGQAAADAVIQTARHVAALYLMQMEQIL